MKHTSRCLSFVLDTVSTLEAEQCAVLGGKGRDHTRFIAIDPASELRGARLREKPEVVDLQMWPVLERLSTVTGDPGFRAMVVRMAEEFAWYGFDPKSGLGYLGQEARLNVVTPGAARANPDHPFCQFKPSHDLPLERLWAQAPKQMARMCRSSYYGLVIGEETMDYNRHCLFGFDDAAQRLACRYRPYHIGFATVGSYLIQHWSLGYARTGDAQFLDWAQRMANKWEAVQHPETGIFPHYSTGGGSEPEKDVTGQEPYHTPVNFWRPDDIIVSQTLMKAADCLKGTKGASGFAEQLRAMALRSARGIAQYCHDEENDQIRNWVLLDGTTDPDLFSRDRSYAEIPGFAFYRSFDSAAGCFYWSDVPFGIAEMAELTSDAHLTARTEYLASRISWAARQLTGPLNEIGQWTFPATAHYIKLMLALRRMTDEKEYLDQARELADAEMGFLAGSQPRGKPEWWRVRYRHLFLDALLELHVELVGSGLADR